MVSGECATVRFLPLAFASCFVWVLILSGAGYFFSGAITRLIGDFHQIGIVLLVIVVIGIAGFYLAERYWLGKKVEEADPERIQEFEQAAQEKFHEIKEEIQERIHLKPQPPRRKDQQRSAIGQNAARPKETKPNFELDSDQHSRIAKPDSCSV